MFIGKPFGRHKMTPIASPNKTLGGERRRLPLRRRRRPPGPHSFFLPVVPLVAVVLTGLVVHAAAQVSDPLESLFKRAVGVKDSSNAPPRSRRVPRPDRQPDPGRPPVLFHRQATSGSRRGDRRLRPSPSSARPGRSAPPSSTSSTAWPAASGSTPWPPAPTCRSSPPRWRNTGPASFPSATGATRRRSASFRGAGGRRSFTGKKARSRSPAPPASTSSFRPSPGCADSGRPSKRSVPAAGWLWPTRSRWSSGAGRPQTRGRPLRGQDHPRRQRAQRRLSMPRQGETAPCAQGHPDGLGRAVLQDPFRRSSGTKPSMRSSAIPAGSWAGK